MKRISTNLGQGEADDGQIVREIIADLFDNGHQWLCCFDTDEENRSYVQVHSKLLNLRAQAWKYLSVRRMLPEGIKMEELDRVYLVETRRYGKNGTFRHYRMYCFKSETVYPFFREYIRDHLFPSGIGWM